MDPNNTEVEGKGAKACDRDGGRSSWVELGGRVALELDSDVTSSDRVF